MLFFDLRTKRVVYDDLFRADNGDLAVFHIGYIPRMLDDRGHIGSDEAAAFPVAQQQRRILPGSDKAVGQIGAEDPERIGPFDTVEHAVDRVEDVAVTPVIVAQQLRHDLGVRLRTEGDPSGNKKAFELYIVFNDAVVYNGDPLILAQMRMGVDIVRFAVSGPSSMSDTDHAVKALSTIRQCVEHFQPAFRLAYLQSLLR